MLNSETNEMVAVKKIANCFSKSTLPQSLWIPTFTKSSDPIRTYQKNIVSDTDCSNSEISFSTLSLADLFRVIRSTGKLLLAFLIGSVATTIGTVVAYWMVPMKPLGREGWRIAAALMGRHIGGEMDFYPRQRKLQIVGEIKAAREALVEVTLRLRSYVFQGFFQKDPPPPPFLAPSPGGSASNLEAAASSNNTTYTGNDPTTSAKNIGGSNSEAVNQCESGNREDAPSTLTFCS